MNSPDALRRAANAIEVSAIGDGTDATLVLLARFIERRVAGTACEDEARALATLLMP